MPHQDYFILMGMGGVFIILGIIAFFWGRDEEKGYYDSFVSSADVREFLEHGPERPGLGALQVGGWIAISIGLSMIIAGSALLLWG
ncbi:hypothetical protein ACFLU8_01740 [Chloroflexota bacterium]